MVNQEMLSYGTSRSCIRELFEYGNRRAAEIGRDKVYDFSIGNPSVPSPKAVNETIEQLAHVEPSTAVHGYTSAGGDAAARKAVAEDLNARYAADVDPNRIFFTCGAAPALTAVLRALSVEGAEIVIPAPFFPEYRVFVSGAGEKAVIVPPDTVSFQLNAEEIEAHITPNTQAVIINSPNNPSGVIYSAETLRALGEMLTRKSLEIGHPIYLIADEPYRELAYDGAVVPFVPSIYPNTVVCYSYSKSLSLPGERIGYFYVPRTCADGDALYAAAAGAARALGHVCAPSLMQHMIEHCAALRPDIEAYDRNRRRLYEALTSYGYDCVKPQGAFYMMIRAPYGTGKEFSDAAKARDLLLVPCEDFGCGDYLRLSTCVSAATVEGSLPIFRELIERKGE